MKFKIEPITGDASFRKFYRIVLNRKSKIIVITKKDKYKNLIVYSKINKFLRENKILAPKLYDYNFSKGFIIIEDFGDLSFYKILIKTKNKFSVYKKLINELIKIQKIKPKSKLMGFKDKPYILNKYSKKYLHLESDLFFDWYLPLFLSKKKNKKIKAEGRKVLSKLYNKIFFPNAYFVHRDYHVQNLIKNKKNIGIIDSQDAIIGNPTYDLTSLINDVRVKTSNKLKNKIYEYYLQKTNKIHRIKSKEFLNDFNILSVQRLLKIIGIFSRLFKRDKKRKYLKFIPYTWKLLEKKLEPEIFLELKKLLDKNIPKKNRKKI
jgi:N-acetylmuramate 1-kinase